MIKDFDYQMDEKEALKGLPPRSKGVDLTSKEVAYATANAPFHAEGDKIEAHPLLISDFVKRGYATKSATAKKQ